MNTKQLTYPTIKIQEQYWIDKETVPDNATNETRGDLREIHRFQAITISRLTNEKNELLSACKLAAALMEPGIARAQVCIAIHNVESAASILSKPEQTTAEPKPKMEPLAGDDLDRIEATCDWYDHYEVERNDFDRGDLRDEGRNPDGEGESYAARNV